MEEPEKGEKADAVQELFKAVMKDDAEKDRHSPKQDGHGWTIMTIWVHGEAT